MKTRKQIQRSKICKYAKTHSSIQDFVCFLSGAHIGQRDEKWDKDYTFYLYDAEIAFSRLYFKLLK